MEQAFPSVFWLEDILALFIILLAILLTIFNLPGNTLLLLGYLGYILVDEPRYLNMQTVLLMVLLYALGEIWDFCISYLGIKREHISWLAVTFIGSGTLIGTCVGTMFLPVLGSVIGGAAGDSSYNAQLAGVIGQNAVENNRMLHREEVDLIQNLAKEYAKEKGISLEEAETQLTRGALYNIDQGWKDAFDSKLEASDM